MGWKRGRGKRARRHRGQTARGKAPRYATAFHFRRFSSGPACEGHRYASQYLTNLYAHSRAAVCTSHASEYAADTNTSRDGNATAGPGLTSLGPACIYVSHARYCIACTRIYSVANAIKPIDEITADRGPLSLSLSPFSLSLLCWICTRVSYVATPFGIASVHALHGV